MNDCFAPAVCPKIVQSQNKSKDILQSISQLKLIPSSFC